jgi:adenosylcobinamide kinase/adenosylcobinamide-phosphate guanylyltransferase
MVSRRILITGGTRSGKSRYAESLLADAATVTYIAPGPRPDPAVDADWARRVAAHRARRPASWTTLETDDLVAALRARHPAVLVDSLGTWLTATIDRMGTWDEPLPTWQGEFDGQLADLVAAWQSIPGPAVAVTEEVGWGLVAEHRSGRIFTDLLGQVNQEIAAVSDQVTLVVAGRPLQL